MRRFTALSLVTLACLTVPSMVPITPAYASLSARLSDEPVFKHENTPANLKLLFETLHEAMKAEDVAKAAALTREVLPTSERLAKAFKDGADANMIVKINTMYAKMLEATKEDKGAAAMFKHKLEQTKVSVHGATTEQIAAKAKEAEEFPGGASDMAGKILKPGMTFYQVEYAEPEADSGIKFHLFFWDGAKWCMAGPLWRADR